MRGLAVVVAVLASVTASVSGGNLRGQTGVGGVGVGLGTGGVGGVSGVGGGFGGGNQGVAYQTGGGGLGGGVGGAGAQVGGLTTLDTFGTPFGAGAGAGGYQVGTAQVAIRDRAASSGQDQQQQDRRTFENADAGAGRQDNQERRGDLRESAFSKKDNQLQQSGSNENRNYDLNSDQASQSNQRQTDVNDKHGISLDSNGRYDRTDIANNAGDKALAARKNAFARQNIGLENIDYGFKKNFDTNFNERGGFKEAVGQDNNNLDVYEEKQRDNRFSKGELDAFRRSNDNNAFQKQDDWVSNNAQRQNINNQYGAADRLQDAAEQKDKDYNSLLDRKNDVFWHRDNAQDKAVRQANDVAQKRADQTKKAQANASGGKGVTDNKYYGGNSFGKGGPAGSNIALGTGATGGLSSAGGVGGGGAGGRVAGGGVVAGGNAAGVGGQNLKGRQEGSGGDYVNAFRENALQSDLANQQQTSAAQSDATAKNDYNRGRGVDDSIEVNGQREGQWAKNRAGLRDANSQGFNGANADVNKAALLADNSLENRISDSNLDAANRNLQAQELDRINFKRNQVDNNQRIRKQKKFYHDKNEDGTNNEVLNYNRNRGNQDFGEEQQAQKEARTRYNNAADDAKVNQMRRAYNNLDARRISDADATNRQKDNTGGWNNEDRRASNGALSNREAFDNGRSNSDFDSLSQNLNNRNQQLWDKARKDVSARNRGSSRDRTLDGNFAFQPQSQGRPLGNDGSLGAGGVPLGGSGGGGFGSSRGGFGGGSNFGSSRGGFGSSSFMAPVGGSSFGSSNFRGGSGGGSYAGGSSSGVGGGAGGVGGGARAY
ncbi:keratin, type I cytoskeletal 10-like [Littorina saxatilis]|uniref:Uncharacterized protein n=1 Tax=Littorina saxatilis TaxID=31220 RepID=A0AAN9B2L2_9CAEN